MRGARPTPERRRRDDGPVTEDYRDGPRRYLVGVTPETVTTCASSRGRPFPPTSTAGGLRARGGGGDGRRRDRRACGRSPFLPESPTLPSGPASGAPVWCPDEVRQALDGVPRFYCMGRRPLRDGERGDKGSVPHDSSRRRFSFLTLTGARKDVLLRVTGRREFAPER